MLMPIRSGKKTPPTTNVQKAIKAIKSKAEQGNSVAYYCTLYLLKARSGDHGDHRFPPLITQDKKLFQSYAFLIESIQQQKEIDKIRSHFSPKESSHLCTNLFPYPAKDLAERVKKGSLDALKLLIAGAKKNLAGACDSLDTLVHIYSNQLPLPTHHPYATQCIHLFVSHQTLSHH